MMNRSRVLAGGLVAGVLLVATGVGLGHGVLGPEYVRAFASHRAHPVNVITVLENTSLRLAYGFLIVFLYASIRPRFGAGARTALLAALLFWLAALLPRNLLLSEFGILNGAQLAMSLAYSAAEIALAALVGAAIYREGAPRTAGVAALLLLVVGAGACSSTSKSIANRGGPDSMGISVLDCQLRFELTGDPHRFDQYITTGVDRFGQLQGAQSASFFASGYPTHPVAARPTRGLLLLGPLRAGTYMLEQVGLDREFIDVNRRQGFEFVREPVAFRPGIAGTNRIAFVVEPGGVTYVGRMAVTSTLRSPEADAALPEPRSTDPVPDKSFVQTRDLQTNTANLRRIRWIADDQTWEVKWDRDVRHEISAWERIRASLKQSEWKAAIEKRLEFLRAQTP